MCIKRQGQSTLPFSFLLHYQIILYGFNPFDATCNLACFLDSCFGIDKTAQLHDTLAGLDIDSKRLEGVVFGKKAFDLGRND